MHVPLCPGYIFGLYLLFFGSPPVTVTTAGTRCSNSTTSIQGLNVGFHLSVTGVRFSLLQSPRVA